jgi:hypothetical protein
MYHPFWTAFPNNPTLRVFFFPSDEIHHDPNGNITLFVVPFQRTLIIILLTLEEYSLNDNSGTTFKCLDRFFLNLFHHINNRERINQNTIINQVPDFKFELFPFHSPLLKESLLVSFPPLTDMLKFSGYPYLI